MRGSGKLKQNIYLTRVTETRSGIDLVKVYSKPKLYRLSVSATAGVPFVAAEGVVPDYDRFITVFKAVNMFAPNVGDLLYVDVAPELDEDGELAMSNGKPNVPPDYVVVRQLTTARGQVFRYGIKRVSYGND